MSKNQLIVIFVFIAVLSLVGFGAKIVFDNLKTPNISPYDKNKDQEVTFDKLTSKQENEQALSPGNQVVQNTQTQNKQMNKFFPSEIKQYSKFPGVIPETELKNKKAVLETNKGIIEFEIYPEATKAASNFIFLTEDKFYDGLTFHRVVPKFVIQGGDPLGNGQGGPGYTFEDEPVTKPYKKGVVAMANAGPNTNGSQFFIMIEDNLNLPPNYTIFGSVIKGQEVVDKIQVGDIMQKVTIQLK